MINVRVLAHPLSSHYLTIARDKNTSKKDFSAAVERISFLLAAEMYKDLFLTSKVIQTPLQKHKGKAVSGNVVIMPVLRAGLSFVKGFTGLYPDASVSHIGIYRNEQTLEPVNYYFKYPHHLISKNTQTIILEPMIATGGSAIYAVQTLLALKIPNIKIASLIAAPEGISALKSAFSKHKQQISLYTCAIDSRLNKHGYIVPGLGDAGDRFFGT